MTVHSIDSYNNVPSAVCIWFDKSKQDKGVFALAMLVKEEES